MKPQKKSLQVKKYFKGSWHLLGIGTVTMLIVTVIMVGQPLILREIVDNAITNNNSQLMTLLALLYIASVLTNGGLSYIRETCIAKLGLITITRLKQDVFAHLLKLPLSYIDSHTPGALMARVENDGEKVKYLFSQTIIDIIANLLFFIGVIIVMMTINPIFTIVMTAIAPVVMFISMAIFSLFTKWWEEGRQAYAETSSHITEYSQGAEIVHAFNRIHTAEKKVNDSSARMRDVYTKFSFADFFTTASISFIMACLFPAAVIKIFAPSVFSASITPMTLFLFLMYGRQILDPIMAISENFKAVQQSLIALKRITTILDEKPESSGERILEHFSSTIEFKNVWFAYKEEEWVLEDVSFTIKKGQTLALIGASGSGKSTCVSLLMRFYSPQKGEILVDGYPINEYNLATYRKKLGLVLQDIFLFPGNILENIRIYNDEISESQVDKALESVQAKQFTDKLEHGMMSDLAERGGNLSQGERQLLSFGRACAVNPDIIILDEATASVDPRTEALMRKSAYKLLEGRTSVIVAHRLSSIVNAHEILLFKNGKIICRGTHKQLLETSCEYEELVNLQMLKTNDDDILRNEA